MKSIYPFSKVKIWIEYIVVNCRCIRYTDRQHTLAYKLFKNKKTTKFELFTKIILHNHVFQWITVFPRNKQYTIRYLTCNLYIYFALFCTVTKSSVYNNEINAVWFSILRKILGWSIIQFRIRFLLYRLLSLE